MSFIACGNRAIIFTASIQATRGDFLFLVCAQLFLGLYTTGIEIADLGAGLALSSEAGSAYKTCND